MMCRSRVLLCLLLCLFGVVVFGVEVSSSSPIKKYNIDPKSVTVGGLSSGAFFAIQYGIAHSSTIAGTCAFAGGPYLCAAGEISVATTICMDPVPGVPPNPEDLIIATRNSAVSGLIDPVEDIAGHKVFMYSGTHDTVVHPPVMKSAYAYYNGFVEASSGGSVVANFSIPSEHCFPTDSYGNECGKFGSPFICNCGYSGAQKCFETLYGNLQTRVSYVPDNLFPFDQTQFGVGFALSKTGYIYVPTRCQNGGVCKLNAMMHGCEQTIEDVGMAFVEKTGVLDWAEANDIIVVFPQVMRSDVLPTNPKGCWDWWGQLYSGQFYAFKSGPQVKFLHAILSALQGQSYERITPELFLASQ